MPRTTRSHSSPSLSNNQSEQSTSASTHVDSVNALVRAILFRDQSKEPFRKTEVFRLALHSNKIDQQLWSHAACKLKNVFGLILQELEGTHEGLFILTKEQKFSFQPDASLDASLNDGLLVVVLGVIFMSGGSIEENTLISLLQDLNIYPETQVLLSSNNKVACKDLIASVWKKQMYLEIKQIRNQKKTYEWGQRAHLEISRQEILALMARIMNSRPEQWREQYRMALGTNPSNNTSTIASRTLNSSQSSRQLPEEITIVANASDDDDDGDVEFVYDSSQSQSTSTRGKSRAPLKPRNSVDTSTRTHRSRRH